MNSDLFLVARLSLEAASASAEWLVDDQCGNYEEVDALDLPDVVLSRVFELYRRTYAGYGNLLIPSPEGLLKYNRWIVFLRDGASSGSTLDDFDPDSVVAFALMKTTRFGLKAGLRGSDGSREGKKAVVTFATSSYNAEGVFGEISGKLEKVIAENVPVVPFRDAEKVLTGLGKRDAVVTEKEHYRRHLANIGDPEKVMVGHPVLST